MIVVRAFQDGRLVLESPEWPRATVFTDHFFRISDQRHPGRVHRSGGYVTLRLDGASATYRLLPQDSTDRVFERWPARLVESWIAPSPCDCCGQAHASRVRWTCVGTPPHTVCSAKIATDSVGYRCPCGHPAHTVP